MVRKLTKEELETKIANGDKYIEGLENKISKLQHKIKEVKEFRYSNMAKLHAIEVKSKTLVG